MMKTLFEKIITDESIEYKILSYTVYKRIVSSKKLDEISSKLNLLDKKIHALNMELDSALLNIKVPFLHEKTFGPYRNCFSGKNVVLVASGPTSRFHKPIKNAIYVGVNNACLLENVKLDFLFCQDFYMDEEKRNAIVNYRKGECKKFFGIISPKRIQACLRQKGTAHVRRIPHKYIVEADASEYYINELGSPNTFSTHLECDPVPGASGVAFAALQFILHTHPSKIYLVGCDCSSGFFYKSNVTFDNSPMIREWKECKKFMDEMYPDIKVISLNPVGLKGLFQDEFTTEYLREEEREKI